MIPEERGSAAEIKSWRSARERAGAERAVRARWRERVGRVGVEELGAEDEEEGWVSVEAVAKRSKAARMEVSVAAVMRCCFAREEGASRGGCARKRAGGGGARGRRLGGWVAG